jgi:hypothetical protein
MVRIFKKAKSLPVNTFWRLVPAGLPVAQWTGSAPDPGRWRLRRFRNG